MATSGIFTVKLGLVGLSPSELVERGRNHVKALTGNATYPKPTPDLIDLTAACDALEAADLEVAQNGGKLDYLTRNERIKELRALIKELAGYVQAVSEGDPEKIASAAFTMRKLSVPVGQLPAPGNLRARLTDMDGEIALHWAGVRNHLIYILYICEGDPLVETNWKELLMLSRNSHIATGLTSGKPYSFRVVAVGTSGASPASDPATTKPR